MERQLTLGYQFQQTLELDTFQYGVNMDTMKDLEQMFVQNLGNKITPELANGMLMRIQELIPIIKEVTHKPEE